MKKPKKKPVIRKGQKKPYRKATNQEIEHRVEFLAAAIAANPTITKWAIHKLMGKEYGLHWVTVDQIYIIRARKLLRQRSSLETQDVREITTNALLQAIAKEKGAAKVAVLRLLCDIHGVQFSARRFSVGGDADMPAIKTKEENPLAGMTADELRKLVMLDTDEK